MEMDRQERAKELFEKGFNCAQAVSAAFTEPGGREEAEALKCGGCFGGGMRQGGPCGAVSGALMALGRAFGSSDERDKAAKKQAEDKAAAFCEAFREKHGELGCIELLGYDIRTPEGKVEHKGKSGRNTCCMELVGSAAMIAERLLGEKIPLTPHEMLARVKEQEMKLQFYSFSNDDAVAIGLSIFDACKRAGKSLAINILFNDFQLFRCSMEGTNTENDWWMGKKLNTVRRCGVSSKRAELEVLTGERPVEEWQKDEESYALCGGGFPIRIRGAGVCGCILTSNLPDVEDHQFTVDALSEFLGVEVPSILE